MLRFHPTVLTSAVFLLYYINTAQSQMQMPMASFSDADGESTFAVYNGKVFKIPKKEEPGMFSGLFNFDLMDNALVRTIVGWTDYFSGSSSETDPLDSNSLSASQNAAQFAMPGQPLPSQNMNGFGFGDQKFPIQGQGQGFQGNFYPRPPPPPPQWQQGPPKNYGNYPYNYKSQYPPRPMGSFQQMPIQPQAPVQPPPQFFPQPPKQAPMNPPPQVPYSQPLGDYESGPNYYSSPSVDFPEGQGNTDNFAGNENAEDITFKRFYDSSINHEAMESNEIAEKSSHVGLLARQDMEMDVGADNPCPIFGQWKWDGTVCVALGPQPRWGCRPNDLVSTGRVAVCRNKIWYPNER